MSTIQYRMHLRYPYRKVRITRNRQLVSFPETHVGTGTYSKSRYNSASKTICSTCRQLAVTSINKRDIRTLIMYKSCFKGTIKSCVLGAFLCVSKLLEPHTHSKIVGMKITACVMFAAHFHSPYPLYFILNSLSVSSFYTSFVFRHFYIFCHIGWPKRNSEQKIYLRFSDLCAEMLKFFRLSVDIFLAS